MKEVIQIRDEPVREKVENSAWQAAVTYENRALQYALSEEFNIYQAAVLAENRTQYEDLYLFAAYPKLYAAAKETLDNLFGSSWGARNGLGTHIPALIDWLESYGVRKWDIGDGSSSVHHIVPAVRYITPFSMISRVSDSTGVTDVKEKLRELDENRTYEEVQELLREEIKRRGDICGVRLFISSGMGSIIEKFSHESSTRLKETKYLIEGNGFKKSSRYFDHREIAGVVKGIRESYSEANPKSLVYHGVNIYLAGEKVGLPNHDGRVQVQCLFAAGAAMRAVTSAAIRQGGLDSLSLSESDLKKLVEITMLKFRDVK